MAEVKEVNLKSEQELGITIAAILAFDEFSCSNRPNTSYGWAIKNTRPEVPSDERARERLNGLLTIDLTTAKEHLKLTKEAKTDDIALYFTELTTDLILQNPHLETIHLFMDNNPTHKKKMKALLDQKLQDLYRKNNFPKLLPAIELHYFAAYTPKDNPVEYGIRLIRQLALHHLPLNTTLDQIKSLLETKIRNQKFMTIEKLNNIISYILGVGRE